MTKERHFLPFSNGAGDRSWSAFGPRFNSQNQTLDSGKCAAYTVAPKIGLRSVGNGFDHALRSHGWNNSRELVTGGTKQSTKLNPRAFTASVHHQHI